MTFSRISQTIAILTLSGALVSGQVLETKERKQTLFQYLQEVDLKHVELTYDLDSLIVNKFTANSYHGHIAFDVDTGTLVLPVEVSVRGKFRRKECDTPPIKLEFKKGDLKDAGLKKADSYKLVTHCMNNKQGPQYLFKEYTAYKMYNQVTDSSFQVQVFPITYQNIRTGEKFSNHAMLIESNEEIEDRLGGKFDDDFGSTVDSVDAFSLEMTSIFNYMIGNQDMNLATCHNVKLLKIKGQKEKLTIPYDFDFSLFVNARYAFPKIDDNRSVRRKYNGYRKNKPFFDQALTRYTAAEERFKETIKSCPDLKGSHRGECLRYIADFFYRLRNNQYQVEYIQ